ncbi:SDR family oxidoreductase [Kineosporia succinea]|uniref:Nucleoside-diphosphate-sugar epimerase n=1 Tax=Kineosporia succinea TaxID=84632 RepID=A0ABT9P4M4_9ACTN|nr:SDR family oxidoreductase [Kineosporia succinea]MDP9827650.1 nucleoside-diphosphate-sugar epimerase [Kineosporia succinea]
MRIFLTGATGFIGSHVARELLSHGHQVVGLTRSDDGAAKLEAAGVEVYRGTIDDPETLRRGAAESDGVVHTAFDHSNLADLPAAAVKDLAVFEVLGPEVTGKPFVTTFGTTMLTPGAVVTEEFRPADPQGRALVEAKTLALGGVSVRPATVVHARPNLGFVSLLTGIAREKGVSAYPGDGSGRWPAVHVTDLAVLYRLAVEKTPGATVLHGIQEEGVTSREIAEGIGRVTGLPVESRESSHFGWLGGLFVLEVPASSAITRELTGWAPTGPTLLEELQAD